MQPHTDTTRHNIIVSLNNGKSHNTIALKQYLSTETVELIRKLLNHKFTPARIGRPAILSEPD